MVIFEQDFEKMLEKYQGFLEDKKKFTALVKDLSKKCEFVVNGL